MKENKIIISAILGALLIIGLIFGALPVWKVWQQGLSGEAMLKKAEQEKKILIELAKAEEEAAVYRAKAIAIVGGAAKEYPEYRQQELLGGFTDALRDGTIDQIIYVPTEASVPITEATRLK